ncbi:HPr kinase/phosphorylase [Candidatus Mycoplasma haematolamae str. Purdue]|uniref:HPr kinase/phosphorylase n=1 Tax=Mycoplasma haematolamae (strain Purdue) TaxID=1212765 RepID=I7BAX6_MYCHA|nr:HPr kinase/phosphorylase [Candidatus Mycoplasma haematolamae str. Purdue]
MDRTSVSVFSIYKRFGGSFVNKSVDAINRKVSEPALSRLGMELNGSFLDKEINTVIVWGSMESEFLSSLSEDRRVEVITSIVKKNPPLFLLSASFTHLELLQALNQRWNDNQSAIIQTHYSTNEIFTSVGAWLSKTLAHWDTIHGSVVSVFGEGVLITGEPGIGKTEVVLDLLRLNHLFLGDDAIRITRFGNGVIARAHPNSSEFIQVRGIGVINIKETIGRSKIIDEIKINLVVELKSHNVYDAEEPLENWGEDIRYQDILDIHIPYYVLPVQAGRNISELIQACVSDHKLKKTGYNSAKAFDKIIKESLKTKTS